VFLGFAHIALVLRLIGHMAVLGDCFSVEIVMAIQSEIENIVIT
jgi:hypothetical protein